MKLPSDHRKIIIAACVTVGCAVLVCVLSRHSHERKHQWTHQPAAAAVPLAEAATQNNPVQPAPAASAPNSAGSTSTGAILPYVTQAVPEPTPSRAQAVLRHGTKTYQPRFYSGQSERIAVGLNENLPVQISWPNDTEHRDVFVQAVHGGRIDGASNAKRFPLHDSKTISFTFTPDAGTGSYAVVLRRGKDEEALNFWVPTGAPQDVPAVRW